MSRVRVDIASFVLIGWLVAACGVTPVESPSASSPSAASAAPAPPSERVEESTPPFATRVQPTRRPARLADLDYLVERLKAIHPNPFLDEGEAAFLERVAKIREDVASMTDAGFLVAVMDLMGHRERDGHSGRVGDGPAEFAPPRLADLAVGLPGRTAGRRRARRRTATWSVRG